MGSLPSRLTEPTRPNRPPTRRKLNRLGRNELRQDPSQLRSPNRHIQAMRHPHIQRLSQSQPQLIPKQLPLTRQHRHQNRSPLIQTMLTNRNSRRRQLRRTPANHLQISTQLRHRIPHLHPRKNPSARQNSDVQVSLRTPAKRRDGVGPMGSAPLLFCCPVGVARGR